MTIPVSLTWRQRTSASTVSPRFTWKGRWGCGLSEVRMRNLVRKVSDTLFSLRFGFYKYMKMDKEEGEEE